MDAPTRLAGGRRRLAKLWVNARMPIIIGLVVIAVAVGGAIGYQRYTGAVKRERQIALQASAPVIASEVGRTIESVVTRLEGSLNARKLAKLLASGDTAALEAARRALAQDPDVISAAILPAGYDKIDKSAHPLIGYAVREMLRESRSSGKSPPPEVQLLHAKDKHIAILSRISGASGQLAGHVRWAVRLDVLSGAFNKAEMLDGYAELSQRRPQAKPLRVMSRGSSSYRQGPPLLASPIKSTPWRVLYWAPALGTQPAAGVGIAAPLAGIVVLVLVVVGVVVVRRGRSVEPSDDEESPALGGEAVGVDAAPEGVAEDANAAPAPPEAQAAAAGEPTGDGELSPSIFRAYDIRGVVDRTLTVDAVRKIGHAIGSEAYERGQQTIVVGCDGRLSGPKLVDALVEGLRSSGRDVIDIGRVPTPVLYFATHYLKTGSGVIVTGSHNPPQYNGLKIMLGGETLFGDAVSALRTRVVSGNLMTGEGSLQTMDVLPEYIRRVTEDVPVALGNAFSVVIDCGNGIAGEVAPKLIRALGHDVIELFCEVDGNFPNHHPDPSKPDNLRDLISAVKENKADIGFALDGDGDRLGVVDGTGRILWPDLQMMLYARDVLSRNPDATIVYDVKCTSKLGKVIKKLGGRPLMWKTGHSFIKSKMKETRAMLAGEMSGHIFFKERWYGFDDAMYTAARMLELLMALKQPPAKVFARLPTGVATPELNVQMAEGEQLAFMDRLAREAQFENAKVTTIDGLRVDYRDGWGLVRASNTTPSLVLRFEGDDEAALHRIQSEFRAVLLAQDSNLSLPF